MSTHRARAPLPCVSVAEPCTLACVTGTSSSPYSKRSTRILSREISPSSENEKHSTSGYVLIVSLAAAYSFSRLMSQIVTERITISSNSTSSKPNSPPAYALKLAFVRSTSGGKSLLSKGRSSLQAGYNTFFDENGVLDQEAFERWVGGAVAAVMEGKTE